MAERPHHLRPGEPRPGDPPGGGRRGAERRHHGHRPLRLPQPGEQRPGLPLHLPGRPGRAGPRDQRGDDAGGHPGAGRAGPGGRAETRCDGAYDGSEPQFGREYLIPKPFDHRVLFYVAPAVAKAAMETGMARVEVDMDEYRDRLRASLGPGREVMRWMTDRARRAPGPGRPHGGAQRRRSSAWRPRWWRRGWPSPSCIGIAPSGCGERAQEMGVELQGDRREVRRHVEETPGALRPGALRTAACARG